MTYLTHPHALAGSVTLRFSGETWWSDIVPFRVDRLGAETRKDTFLMNGTRPHATLIRARSETHFLPEDAVEIAAV
jgi:hypothetical protein